MDILNVRDAAVLKKGDRLSSAARGRQPMKVRMRMDMIWSASTGAVVLDVEYFKSSFSVFDHMSRSSWKDGCRSAFPDWDCCEFSIMGPYIDQFCAYISDAGQTAQGAQASERQASCSAHIDRRLVSVGHVLYALARVDRLPLAPPTNRLSQHLSCPRHDHHARCWFCFSCCSA